jgi:cytochrome b
MTNKYQNNSDLEKSIQEKKIIRVWDFPTRLFHWLLVISIIAAYVSNKCGVSYFKYHLWCGYFIIVLVIFRIVWGLVGTYHSRFINFIRNPFSTFKYTRSLLKGKSANYAGHNPLGALMVVALLLGLLVQAISGLFSNDEIFNLGPLYAYVGNELSLRLTSLHRQLFYWIIGAVTLHIIAVLFHVFIKRDNIVKTMFTGKKNHHTLANDVSIKSSKIWLAVLIFISIALIFTWVIVHAPNPTILTNSTYD